MAIITKRQSDIDEHQTMIGNIHIEQADEVIRMKEEIARLREQTQPLYPWHTEQPRTSIDCRIRSITNSPGSKPVGDYRVDEIMKYNKMYCGG